MGAEVGRVITIHPVDPNDIAAYERTLHTSQEALQARCTEKAVIYTVLGIASAVCGRLANHLRAELYDKDSVLDFRIEASGPRIYQPNFRGHTFLAIIATTKTAIGRKKKQLGANGTKKKLRHVEQNKHNEKPKNARGDRQIAKRCVHRMK